VRIVQAPRAATILYRLLKSQPKVRPWLLPANICPIVPITFFKARVPFELVDISDSTLHMDLNQAAARLERGGIGGVLFAHTYGEASTPVDFFELAKKRDPELVVVDDRCLCTPDVVLPSGSAADVTLYSTGYAKQVDLAFGGYAFLMPGVHCLPAKLPYEPSDYAKIEASYKTSLQERSVFVYRDNDWLQTEAALPPWAEYSQQVTRALAAFAEQRSRMRAVYAQMLPAEIQLPDGYQHWRFNFRVKHRQRLLDAIFSANLFASAHYASLAGLIAAGSCPRAEALADEVVNLFIDHHFTLAQAEQVSAVILANLS
jgi:hypothetical protein